MSVVVTSRVTRGNAVTVFMYFTKPTRTTFTPTHHPVVTTNPTDPTTITVSWWWIGKAATVTTWTYPTTTNNITKVKTGVFVSKITTSGGTSSGIMGKVSSTGVVEAVAYFQITVEPPKV